MKRKYLSVLVPALYPMIMAAMVLLVRQKMSDKPELVTPSTEARTAIVSADSAAVISEKLRE